jgi:intracellular sulfur oxidation DsrE/DsrF family protein
VFTLGLPVLPESEISVRTWSILLVLAAAALLAGPAAISAQALGSRTAGPAIERFGAVYAVESPSFATPTDLVYRVAFEVALGTDEPDQVNPRIETLARFLNMHAQAGVARENMKLALVLHGTAGKDALGNEGYRRRYGVDNPNAELIQALQEYGVRIVLCGQTQVHRGLVREELAAGVEVALSAMTALAAFQSRGYQVNPF